jgi:hypothetical protein
MKWKSAAARRIKSLAGKDTVEAAAIEIGRRLTDGQPLPPTNLYAIFPRLAIQDCYADPELRTAGELRKVADGFEIAYCGRDSVARRRFTIAHEIAHAVFERTGPHCPRKGRELERICDMIAGEILVPYDSLSSLDRRGLELDALSQLANKYQTSLTSMTIRCANRFGLMAAQIEFGEVVWCVCPRGAGVVRPRAQIQRLAKLCGTKQTGETRCIVELRRSQSLRTMQWTTIGCADRRLFIFRDAEGALHPPAEQSGVFLRRQSIVERQEVLGFS